MATRRVTVQVDLQATGNLGRTLEVNRQQAQQLARTVATPHAASAQRATSLARPGQGPEGGLAGGGEGPGMSRIMPIIGRVTAVFGLVVGAAELLGRTFNTLGDRTVRAANAVARMTTMTADVQSAVQGQRLTREQYERALTPEMRAKLEATPAAQRPGLAEEMIRRLRSNVTEQSVMSRAQGESQAALERLRTIAPSQNIPGLFGSGTPQWLRPLLMGVGANPLADIFSGAAGQPTSRERTRMAEITSGLERAGMTQAQIQQRMADLRESGIDLGATTLDDATIRQITQITSGRAGTETSIAAANALRQILHQGGIPQAIGGTTPEEQARMRPVNVGFFESGQFYDRLVQAMHQPEQADQQRRIADLLDALNNTIGTLNTRLPPPPGAVSNNNPI